MTTTVVVLFLFAAVTPFAIILHAVLCDLKDDRLMAVMPWYAGLLILAALAAVVGFVLLVMQLLT